MTNPITTMTYSVTEFLKSATATIMKSYEDYLLHDHKEMEGHQLEPKNFKAFHDGGKSAASHLEYVLKIGKASGTSDDDTIERMQKIRAQEYEAVKNEIRMKKRERTKSFKAVK